MTLLEGVMKRLLATRTAEELTSHTLAKWYRSRMIASQAEAAWLRRRLRQAIRLARGYRRMAKGY